MLKNRINRLFHRHDDGFASLASCGESLRGLPWVKGTVPRPVTGPKTTGMARARHNSVRISDF
jgi:hypothetical protein